MATTIHDGPVSATRVYGGRAYGTCIQLTVNDDDADEPKIWYAIARYDDVLACAKAIVAFDRREQRKEKRGL